MAGLLRALTSLGAPRSSEARPPNKALSQSRPNEDDEADQNNSRSQGQSRARRAASSARRSAEPAAGGKAPRKHPSTKPSKALALKKNPDQALSEEDSSDEDDIPSVTAASTTASAIKRNLARKTTRKPSVPREPSAEEEEEGGEEEEEGGGEEEEEEGLPPPVDLTAAKSRPSASQARARSEEDVSSDEPEQPATAANKRKRPSSTKKNYLISKKTVPKPRGRPPKKTYARSKFATQSQTRAQDSSDNEEEEQEEEVPATPGEEDEEEQQTVSTAIKTIPAKASPVKAKKTLVAPSIFRKKPSLKKSSVKESQHIKIQLLPAERGMAGEILDVRVGDGILVNGDTGDETMPYWIATVHRIIRSGPKNEPYAEGELDNGAKLYVRWYFNPEELAPYGLNHALIQKEVANFGNKEVFWSDYTQDKPAIPALSVCGKCSILRFDDSADSRTGGLFSIIEDASSVAASQGHGKQGASQSSTSRDDNESYAMMEQEIGVGSGRWRDDEHIFYYRARLGGLRRNWERTLSRFIQETITKRKYKLNKHCFCSNGRYDPTFEMRFCDSEVCGGKWYHVQCVLDSRGKQPRGILAKTKIRGLPAKKPRNFDSELWEWTQSPIIRGGAHGLTGNWAVIDSQRSMARARLAGDTDLQNYEGPIILTSEWEMALQGIEQRYAGREAERAQHGEDAHENEELPCPNCHALI